MRSVKVIVTAILLVASVAANAFGSFLPSAPGKSDPQRVRWRDRAIRIAVSNSVIEPNSNIKIGSDVIGAIRSSILAWQRVADIEIEFELSGNQNVSPSGVAGDGVSLITIAQTPENVLLFSKQDPQAESARTRVFYSGKGFITEADIVLNPFQQFSTDGTFGTFDLESTLTHEIGHLLGLRHSEVRGASMSDSLAKNGIFGLSDLPARSLAESDIAAVRELYGVETGNEVCCAAITGKLTTGLVKGLRDIRVWAEESSTGRVAAQVDAGADGSFRLGGLSSGSLTVFWQKTGDSSSAVGVLGTFKLEKDETRVINERISLDRSDVELRYVGVNYQLTDSSITLAPGREHTIYLGGKNLDRKRIAIEFNSPYLTVDRNTLTEQDFGEGISVVKFVLAVHSDTPSGIYSIFATDGDGSISSLLGALNIQ